LYGRPVEFLRSVGQRLFFSAFPLAPELLPLLLLFLTDVQRTVSEELEDRRPAAG
jgi:hypothetical protein